MYLHNSTEIFYKKLAETHKCNKCTINARLHWQQQGDLPKWCFSPLDLHRSESINTSNMNTLDKYM